MGVDIKSSMDYAFALDKFVYVNIMRGLFLFACICGLQFESEGKLVLPMGTN